MKYAVLLRGVNVGGRTIKMADLKTGLEQAGFTGVSTILQSGNVLLETEITDTVKLKSEIEILLSRTFGYPAQVMVMTVEKLAAVVNAYPFTDATADEHRYVIFLDDGAAGPTVEHNLDPSVEAVQPTGSIVYWRVQKGHTLDSNFAKQLAKYSAKNFATNRNVNTLQKILAKA